MHLDFRGKVVLSEIVNKEVRDCCTKGAPRGQQGWAAVPVPWVPVQPGDKSGHCSPSTSETRDECGADRSPTGAEPRPRDAENNLIIGAARGAAAVVPAAELSLCSGGKTQLLEEEWTTGHSHPCGMGV